MILNEEHIPKFELERKTIIIGIASALIVFEFSSKREELFPIYKIGHLKNVSRHGLKLGYFT